MGLITETNAQYYSGQQAFATAGGAGPHTFTCTFNTDLIDLPVSNYTITCLLYTSPSPRDRTRSRMPSSA